jgi:hypothetical protein
MSKRLFLLLAVAVAFARHVRAADDVIVVSQTCMSVSCQGEVGRYAADGTLLDSQQFDSARQEYVTDMAFDADRNLYLLDQSRGRIFGTDLVERGRLATKKELLNSITFDASGNAYLGVFNLTKKRLKKFDARGRVVAEYKTPFPVYSADLAADQCTLFYVSDPRGPQDVHRYNVCAKAPLPDFGRVSAPAVVQIRILPDSGLLVAGHTSIQRYNPTGLLIRSWDLLGDDFWRSVSISADGASFWAVTRREVVRFRISTGESAEQFVTPYEETVGVIATDEWRAASSTPGRPLSPVDLVAILSGFGQIQLTWKDRSDDETSFSLEYQIRNEGWKPLGDVSPNTTAVSVTVPKNVLVYRFRLRAFNSHGASGYSNVAQVPEPSYQDF